MSNKDRNLTALEVIHDDVKFIKLNMATRGQITLIKWAIGGIGTLAFTALMIAANLKGGA